MEVKQKYLGAVPRSGHTEAYFNSRIDAEPALSNAPAASSSAAAASSRARLCLPILR